MAEPRKPDKNGPIDPLVSAAAVGFAFAAQASEFWLGVASGLAKAGQDMLERNRKNDGSPAFSADPASPVEAAKAAARTVMADVERAAQDLAEVTTKFAAAPVETPSKATKPVAKPVEKKPEPKATEMKVVPKATEMKAAPKATEMKATPKATEIEAVPKAVEAKAVEKKVEPKAAEKKAEPQAVAKAKEPEKAAPKPVASPKPKAAKAKAEAAPKPQAATIMPEDFRAPRAIAKPAKPDDLKKLDGVGPRLEQTLNSLGVWTYRQVAAWTPEEIAYVEDMTGLDGAVATNNWLSQAASLAKGETKH